MAFALLRDKQVGLSILWVFTLGMMMMMMMITPNRVDPIGHVLQNKMQRNFAMMDVLGICFLLSFCLAKFFFLVIPWF